MDVQMPVMDGRAAARAIRALIAGLTAAAAAAGTAYIIQVYQSGQGFHPFQSDRELRNDQILFPDSDSASGFREDGDASDDSFWQEDCADDGTTPEGAQSAYLFGQDQPAPEGHLDRAALLNGDSGEVLHIHAGQEKTLYLRTYVGSVYEDGVWTLLPDSAYGGDSSGMLEWLGEQDFDPLTQSAAYYALCTGDDLPESSHLTVDVKAGARCYLYLPGSVSSVAGASPRDIRDARLGARPSSARGFIRRRRPLPAAMWRGMISPPPPSKRAGPRAFPSRNRTPTPGRRSILTASAGPPGARRPPRGLLPQGGPAGKRPSAAAK